MKLLFTAVFTLITVVISPSTTHRIADTPEEGDLRIDINKSNIAPIDDKNAIPEQEPNVETPSSMEGDEEEKKESDLDGNVTECSMETESVIPLEESDITIVGYDDNGSSYIQQQVNSFSFSQDVNVPYKSDKGFRPQYNRPARRNTGKIPVRPNSRAPLSSNRVSNPHIRTTTSQKPIRLLQTGTNRGNRHRPRQRRRRNVNGSGNRRRVQPKTQNNRDIRKPQNNGSDLQKSGESKAYARQTLPREDNDDTDNVVDAEEKPVIKRRLTERNSYGNGILDADEETSRELLKQLTRHFDEDDGVAPVSARPARSPPRSRMTLRTPNVVKGYPVKFTNRDVESRLDDDDIEKALEAMESEQNTETNNTSNKTGPIDPMDSVFSHDTDGSSDDDEGDDMDNDVGPYFSSQSREMDNAKRSTVNVVQVTLGFNKIQGRILAENNVHHQDGKEKNTNSREALQQDYFGKSVMNPGYTNVANCEKVDDSKYSNFLQMQASRKPTYNYMKPKRPIPTEKTRKKYEDAIEHDTLDELMDDDGNDHLRQNDSPDAYMTEGDDADDPDDSPRYNDDDYHSTTGDDDSYEDSEDLNSNMLFNENYDGGDNNVDDKSNEFNAYEENNNGLMDDSPQENEYESENGYNEINDTDDYDDVIEEEEEETGEDIGDVLSPNGLEYLGAGYDLLKGNPLGDTVILLDPGYRASIIQMHWRNDGEGFSNSREYIQPKGAWVRPYISCHKGETISDVGKSQSFTDVLSVDAEVSASFPGDALKFAASLNYNNIKKSQEMKDVKTYVSRSYCFNYVAGIPMSIKWDFTAAFDVALRTLSKNFEEEARGMRCTTRDYRANPTGKDCVELGVSAWMRLFTIFGTHVTSKVYLGGKMLTIMETKASQEADLAKRGIDIQAELSVQAQAAMVDTSVSASTSKSLVTSKESLDTRNSMFVMGGNIYGNGQSLMFNDWAATVSKFSMPIKAEYTPIAMFLDPEYMEAYNDAYLFYGKVLLGDDAIPK